MKRLKVVGCVLLAVLVLLAGCGGQAAKAPAGGDAGASQGMLDPQNPITLTLWHYYVGDNKQTLDAMVKEFNQTVGIECGVVVDAVPKGSIMELEAELSNSIKGVIGADAMPDLFSSYPDKALEVEATGKLVNLNDYFTETDKEKYVPDFLADGIFSGERMLLSPIVKSTELVYLNQTEWDRFSSEADVDYSMLSSWEGVYEAAKAYYQWVDGQTPESPWDGKALMGFDSLANYIIIANKQMGVEVIDASVEGGQALLDETVMRRLFDVYFQGFCLGYFNEVGKFRSNDIKAGDLVGYVGSSSSAVYFPTWIELDNTQQPIDFKALPYPVFKGGQPYAIQQGAGMCVAKSTPQREQGAAVFLKWFTASENNIRFAMTTGYLPVQQNAFGGQDFTQALEKLRNGDESERIVAKVYEIALEQITKSNTYAAKPFVGSYGVRSILQSTLVAVTSEAKAEAALMQQQGLSEEEVLAGLNVDMRFDEWIKQIKASLDEAGIAWQLG